MVLVVGQNSVWQNTYRLRNLARGSVNRVEMVFRSAAGKGANVARALRFLGRDSYLIAYAGGPNGRKFVDACDADGIRSQMIEIGQETRICTTLIDGSGTITEIVEPAPAVTDAESLRFREAATSRIAGAAFLVVSGTAVKGESDDCYLRLIESAHKSGVPVLLDSYQAHGRLALDAGPEILKINGDELAELTGLPTKTASLRAEAARAIMNRYAVRWVIVTRGREGAEGFDEASAVAASAPHVDLVNAIGSGDSFTAGVVAHLLASQAHGSAGADGPDSGAHPGAPGSEPEGLGLQVGNREQFPWGAAIGEAVRIGTAMGTANCMNIKPAHIEQPDFERILAAVRVGEAE